MPAAGPAPIAAAAVPVIDPLVPPFIITLCSPIRSWRPLTSHQPRTDSGPAGRP